MVQQSGSVRDQRASIIDEFGECQRQIRLFAPVLQREQVLRKIIAAWYANADPETGASCDGDVYRVNVGPKARTRIVNCQKLYSVLGEAYWDNAEYPLRVLDTLVIDMTGIISEERTGSRTVQSVLREAAAAAPVEAAEVEQRRRAPAQRSAKRATGRATARGGARA